MDRETSDTWQTVTNQDRASASTLFFQFPYGSNENELSCFIRRALHLHVKMNKALQFAHFHPSEYLFHSYI
jgi:hypothetical protein